MSPGIPANKLLRTAILTSVILIGVLAITPHAVGFRSFSKPVFVKGIVFLAFFIIFMWLVNIALIYIAEKYQQSNFEPYKRYILSYLVCLPGLYFLQWVVTPHTLPEDKAPAHTYAIIILGLILNTIVLIMQDLVLLREKKARIEVENAELKVKNIEATNQQLKQQIHPHFLFNSLSTLKTLIRKDADKAEDYLVKLSALLRASLLSNTPNTVTLQEELNLCHDYLDMQKLRFGKALEYHISIPGNIREAACVPVFSLLLLLENAIKHNSLTQESPLHISMDYRDGRIVTSNNMQPKPAVDSSTGLGLKNLSERYALLSGDTVDVSNNGKIFSVSIQTLDHEDNHH
jgi:two-component system LytT family sensor kinase